jgi:glycosyltransferase involved in cell wall biosynthesis
MCAQNKAVPSPITIVLPALNEAAAVGTQVVALLAHDGLRQLGIRRVIVVDNGSDDQTAEVAALAGAQVVREPRRGYGFACMAGVQAAAPGDIILLMDADGSDDPAGAACVAGLVALGEAELAMGSRVRGRAERGALTPQQRAGNALAAVLLRQLAGLHLTDLGPLRAIGREALLALDMREMTFGWSTEMLLKAGRAGYRVVEVPVDYHRRTGGRSKVAGTLMGTLRASRSILATIGRYGRWQPRANIAGSGQAAIGQPGLISGRMPAGTLPGDNLSRIRQACGD